MSNGKVLVAGASGLVGLACVRHFIELGWDVVGVSRRVPSGVDGASLLSVDLTDAGACEKAFAELDDITHVVYAALQEQPGLYQGWLDPETINRNAQMLRNLFEPFSAAVTGLQHVTLLHGTKAYGVHHPSVGARGLHVPLREREPRRDHPNFYFLQEDYLRGKQRESSFRVTIFRPTVIYGDAPGANMNPLTAIGVYAALLRDEGRPLDFPGGPTPAIAEAVDTDLVAHAIAWAATSPNAHDETFNVTNGDVFMWEHVWPAIADVFGMEPGESRPFSFVEDLPKRDPQWAALVDRYGLSAPKSIIEFVGYNSLVYANGVLGGFRADSALASGTFPMVPLPLLNSTIKLRQAGFHECIDTEDMFRKWFTRMQHDGTLPPRP